MFSYMCIQVGYNLVSLEKVCHTNGRRTPPKTKKTLRETIKLVT